MEATLERPLGERLNLQYRSVFWFWLGLPVILATALGNIGIIALDDYTSLISTVIPVQNHTVSEILQNTGIRSPVPNLVLLAMGHVALGLGIDEPTSQLRFILFFVGLFSYLVHALLGALLFRQGNSRGDIKPTIATFFMAFYFAAPLFFTRPMIESLSAPYLFLSLYFACKYWRDPKLFSICLDLLDCPIYTY